MDKIVNFLETQEEVQPIERNILSDALNAIPKNVSLEYSEAMACYIEQQIILKNIICSSDKPHLVKHLIEGLDEYQLGRLRTIVTILAREDCEEQMNAIVQAFLDTVEPSQESFEKATALIRIIKGFNINYKEKAVEVAQFVEKKLLTESCIFCRMQTQFAYCVGGLKICVCVL